MPLYSLYIYIWLNISFNSIIFSIFILNSLTLFFILVFINRCLFILFIYIYFIKYFFNSIIFILNSLTHFFSYIYQQILSLYSPYIYIYLVKYFLNFTTIFSFSQFSFSILFFSRNLLWISMIFFRISDFSTRLIYVFKSSIILYFVFVFYRFSKNFYA